MAYTTIDNPELYFQCEIWTGNDASPRAFTLDGDEDMQPDLVWIKNRGSGNDHILFDAVRGVDKSLRADSPNAEDTTNNDGSVQSFDTDGFTVHQPGTGDDKVNNSGSGTYVGWCWKESATAGFDIVSYTGNGCNRTISHSLSSAKPAMMIVKQRSESRDWWVYNKNLHGTDGATGVLYLSTDDAAGTSASTSWNSTAPTTSVFSLGTTVGVNKNTETYINYLFSEVQGYSKFGDYTGNGNANGAFIYTGFRPAFVLIKGKIQQSWDMMDNKRSPHNPVAVRLYADLSNAENGDPVIDFVSNGFKIRDTLGANNGSGDEYIYMAFAEQPFVNSNGVPNNAR